MEDYPHSAPPQRGTEKPTNQSNERGLQNRLLKSTPLKGSKP